ncbi:MAG TPA: hypothetical protein VFK52_08915 [Nocardioidaceae bacterium]|nr:hypothetical protein [Nocardioidaceae bacterium]
MYDEDPLTAPLSPEPAQLDPVEVVQKVLGPGADAWLAGLTWSERTLAADALKRALIAHELAGNYTTPDLLTAFERLGGSDADLDAAVLDAAVARRATEPLSPAGLAVVWSRLLRVEEQLSEGEIRSWLAIDMIRGLAAKAATWTRFSGIELADWARNPSATRQEDTLASYLIGKHPTEAAAVLAQAMREEPHMATRLASRLDEKTRVSLAAAIVDDPSIPAAVRVTLAGQAGEAVKSRARAMVVRELGVTDDALAALSAGDGPEVDRPADSGELSPAMRRSAWTVAGVAFFIGSILSLSFMPALLLSTAMFVIAWYVGREVDEA